MNWLRRLIGGFVSNPHPKCECIIGFVPWERAPQSIRNCPVHGDQALL